MEQNVKGNNSDVEIFAERIRIIGEKAIIATDADFESPTTLKTWGEINDINPGSLHLS